MRNVRQETMKPDFKPINIGGLQIPEIRYADDTVLLTANEHDLLNIIKSTQKFSEQQNLFLNMKRQK